ncbi:MAG TPA: hydroxyacid dehydrogenase [Amaricoccus sp.]|nr:hydroxyacid dehydrogenase [Amaricoccus sp.]
MTKPLAISAPFPRTLDLIFTPEARADLHARYEILETDPGRIADLAPADLARARYIIGQPPLSSATLAAMPELRCIFNVESNLLDNMPYDELFARGIHTVTTGAVFAEPVAELGLGLALDLARGITDADLAFREGRELWGGDGNTQARLLSGSEIGLIGFGDLGRALARLLAGFRPRLSAFDPWLPPSILREQGVEPAPLDTVLSTSDTIFVVASVTSENQGFLGAPAFARMRPGAALILLSRAAVVDFPALLEAVRSGRIRAATDVFPEEPPAADDPVRTLPGLLRSAHRAGALDAAFKRMGDMVLEDMDLLDRGLPPLRCKRAERETVSRMRSKPVTTN